MTLPPREEERKRDIRIDFVDRKMEQTAPLEHNHDVYEIAFFLKANVQIFVSHMKYDIRDGSLLFIKPYDIHRILYHPDFHYIRYVINFDKPAVQPLLAAIDQPSLLEQLEQMPYKKASLDLKQRTHLAQLCKELLTEAQHVSRRHFVMQLKLALLLVQLKQSFDDQKQTYRHKQKDQKVRLLIDYIDSHYKRPIALNELEEAVGMNKYYMSHLFKEITGLTIIEYVHSRRVIEAQKLLLQTDKPIFDICFDCGFHNVQHFGRIFKQITDMTPTQYRRTR